MQTNQKPGQQIVERINQTRHQIRVVELVTILVTLIACLFAFLLISVLVDHWLFKNGTPSTLRYLGLLLIGGFGIAYFVRRLIPLLRFPVNPAYAAEVLEKNHPDMKNRLLNWVFLRREKRDKTSPQAQTERMVIDSIGRETAASLKTMPEQLVVDCTAMIRWGIVLAVVLGLFCLYMIVSPKNTLQSVARAATPFFDIESPQSIVIKAVEPGNVTAYQGETIQVKARLDRSTKKPVHLVYSTDDGRLIDQRVPMQGSEDGMRFECRFPPGKRGFEESVTYRVEVGDGRSKNYAVTVKPAITIDVKSVEYQYPAYTKLPARTVESSGDLRAVEGTIATITAKSNIAMSRAILLPDGDTTRAIRLNLSASKTEATGVLTLAFEANQPDKPVCTSYTLRCWDDEQRSNPLPSVYRVETIRDETPTIKWADQISETEPLQVPLNQPVDVAVEACDPDFGLQQVRLRGTVTRVVNAVAQREGNTLPETSELPLDDIVLLKNPPRTGTVTIKQTLVPSKIGLRIGDRVTYFAEAVDTKTPNANTATTSTRVLVVIDIDPDKPLDPQINDEPQEQNEANDQNQGGQNQNQNDSQQDQGDSQTSEGDDSNTNDNSGDDGDTGENRSENNDDGKENGDQNEPSDQQQSQNRDPNEQQRAPSQEQQSQDPQPDGNREQPGDQQPGNGQTGDRQQESGPQNRGQQNGDNGLSQDASQSDGTDSEEINTTGSNGQQDNAGQQNQNGGQSDGANNGSTNQQNTGSGQQQSNRPGQGNDATGNVDAGNNGERNADTSNAQQTGQKREQPIDGESNPADVFNEVVKHMQENGKWDDKTNRNPNAANQSNGRGNQNTTDNQERNQPGRQHGDQEGEQRTQGQRQNGQTQSQNEPDQQGNQPGQQNEAGENTESQSGRAPEQMPEHDNTRTSDQTDAYRTQNGNDPNAEELDGNADKPIYNGPDDTGQEATEAAGTGRNLTDDQSQSELPRGGNDRQTDPNDTRNAARSQANDTSDNQRNQSPNEGPNQSNDPTNNQTGQSNSGGSSQTPQGETPNAGNSSETRGGNEPAQPSTQQQQKTRPDDDNDNGNDSATGGGNRSQQQGRGNAPDDLQESAHGPDAANLDYTRQATDLALRYLEDELGKERPDSKLLDRLGGWDQNDLRRFVDRWREMQQQAHQSPGTNADRKYEQFLRNLGNLAPKATIGTQRNNRQQPRTTTTESQKYNPPKGKYENLMKAYTEGIGQLP